MTIHFATKRGRPRKQEASHPARGEQDFGTQELVLKRNLHSTAEPIDLLLEYALLSPEEHRMALHFRWLYTLRYGIERTTSSDLLIDEGTREKRDNDEQWRKNREVEFREAATALHEAGCYDTLCNLVIHSESPLALRRYVFAQRSGRTHSSVLLTQAPFYQKTKAGLKALLRWQRNRKRAL